MAKSLPRFTREFDDGHGSKIAVKIEPENNQVVSLVDTDTLFGVTLDAKTAHQLGHTLIKAARIAAINVLDPAPFRSEPQC